MSSASVDAPNQSDATPSKSSASIPPQPLVPLRDRLLYSDKARTQGAGTGEDRELTGDVKNRRKLVWTMVFGFIGAMTLASVKFFFPRVLFEPKTRFSIGFPGDFAMGVDTRYQAAYRIWVVRDAQGIFVLFAKCTHLGCTPDWKETDHKFKCPCHGSGFDMEGVNFEGPAPRPLDRTMVELDASGQLIVDKAMLFPYEQWGDPRARVNV
ncbi:MAG TPA: ubiquinol-cytochrome c reductase iron-sulfur subunit [Phycisphaerae bacterium]|nr:ubiquinol-cytochrome c reductase iron-sulfur subunit [Phycisphaerales bacterium]HNO79713.1 ubiquinol-cytochrome c reductase iron-sulfur subunit [Phycisphaerae bacterium]